ncbi:MAG: phosphatase PAP2 family protein [Alteromonadaceae bacterium]|nr:phosphatase PAP2 family protein [Alteromonadaceae bacterium]
MTFNKIFLLLSTSFLSLSALAKSNTERAGDLLQYAIPLISFSSTLLVEDNNKEHYAGSIAFIKSAVAAELSALALKKSISAQRPNGECCDSFPSGHTTLAFVGASFVQFRYGWKYAIPAYVAASYVGYSRVQTNQHYTRDVVAGAAIGILSSYIFTEKYHGFAITPYAFNKEFGVQINADF